MTWFPDLSPFAYGFHPASWTADGPPGTGPEVLYGWDDDGWGEGAFPLPELNVGWLDPRHGFPRGEMAPELVRKLESLCRESRYHLMRGWHHCGFCDDRDARSHAEIRIMGEGVVYAAPTLIAHYVASHGYLPPAGFVRALAACDGLAQPDPQARRPVLAELIPRAPVAIPELQERIRAQQEAGYRHHTFPEVALREDGDHVAVFARIVPRPGTAPIERSWRIPRAALLNPEQAAAGIISMLDRVHMQLPGEEDDE